MGHQPIRLDNFHRKRAVKMTYSYNFVVRNTGHCEWTISAENSTNALHVLHRVLDADDALSRANAWASSWNSVNVRLENEQDKKQAN